MLRNLTSAAVAGALMAAAGSGYAGMLGSTVDITAANGFSSGGVICKNGSAIGRTVGAGAELVAADWSGGCVGYYSADLSDDQITLTGIERGNYSFASLNVHIGSGPAITGVFFGGYTDNFFIPSDPNNDSNFSPSITFDADDINIVWDTFDDASQFSFNGPANGGQEPFGTASFRVTTAAAVPEPTTLALLGLGLAGLGFSRRKQ